MADPSLDDYRWLVSGSADSLLADLAAHDESAVQRTTRLRRQLPAARAHLVLEQLDLRRRAKQKFASADKMFFTRLALEQATDQWVAGHKAQRFASAGTIVDLCCGIGGDLLDLAQGKTVLGVDRNPIMATIAAANLERLAPASSAGLVVAADAVSTDLRAAAAWHIDPDRRPYGRRTTRAVLHSPAPDAIDEFRAQCPAAAVKLAPAAELPRHWQSEAELEWIGRDRQCRQLVAWFGPLANVPGRRTATVIAAAGARTIVERPGATLPMAERVGRFVFEPDAAVLAAALTASLAAEHGLAEFTAGVGYLTADVAVSDPALACFEVLEMLPLRAKLIAGWLRERNIGQVEIKKRGVSLEPEQWRRQLRLAGSGEATLLIAPVSGKPTAIVARRLPRH